MSEKMIWTASSFKRDGEQVREAFNRSPRKSVRRASLKTRIPMSTGCCVIRERMRLTPYKLTVRANLNEKLPGRWIGRVADGDNVVLKCLSHSPDLTQYDFFLWSYVKGL